MGGVTGAAVAAVDLGASSGRVMLGCATPDALELTEVHRFANGAVDVAGALHWDVLGLWREVVTEVAPQYPDVQLEHVLADAMTMYLDLRTLYCSMFSLLCLFMLRC